MSDELRELLGAYALDGLVDDAERADLERFLTEDGEARAEQRRLEAVVDILAETAVADAEADDLADPPAQVWDAIAAHVASTSPPRLVGLPTLAAPAPAPLPAVRRFKVLAVAAAIVALAGAAGLGRLTAPAGGGATPLEVAQDLQRSSGSLSSELLDGAGVSHGRLFVGAKGNGYVLAPKLARLEAGRSYQLWALDGAAPISVALLGAAPDAVGFAAPANSRKFAISVEPTSGSVQPTTTPLVSAAVV